MTGLVTRASSLVDLAFALLRPRKKSMRLDVRMKRLSSPYPRNIHKKQNLPSSSDVLREILG
jgi:hypothetical protein